jgi:predicted DNA-binding transcriptional regulator AlpA
MATVVAVKSLTLTEVCSKVRVCRKTLMGWVRAGLVPQRSRLGNPRVPRLRWRADEVEQFMRARPGGAA